MQTETILLPSSDGLSTLYGYLWTPEPGTEVKALIQFVHGMCEHMGRYARFAEYFTSRGFAVIGHDHLGHGKTMLDMRHCRFFAEKDGCEKLLTDISTFTEEGKKRFPDVPHFILGHSMGSFLLRAWIARHSRETSGAVIMGTGRHVLLEVDAGLTLARIQKLFVGGHKPSKFLALLSMGGYNKPFEPADSPYEWLSQVPEIQKSYDADPNCGKLFTVSAWIDFFKIMRMLAKKQGFENMRKDLPLYFVSGSDDPVGGEKAVPKVVDTYDKSGFTDITMVLLPGDRHEVMNEPDGKDVMRGIADWMEARM